MLPPKYHIFVKLEKPFFDFHGLILVIYTLNMIVHNNATFSMANQRHCYTQWPIRHSFWKSQRLLQLQQDPNANSQTGRIHLAPNAIRKPCRLYLISVLPKNTPDSLLIYSYVHWIAG